jgi:hypothetical protein
MRYPRRAFVLLCALIVLTPVARLRAASAEAKSAALTAITSEKIKRCVDALADDTFEGREAGSRGNRAAGIYVVERIKKHGLRGGGPKGGYYQPFGNYHNILALAEGSDPQLKDQVIIASAHYDHVGYGTNRNSYGPIGRIHNGADDNASGVAGLLEVMDAVCALGERPKRSILFALWDGEEKGLLGSQHWVEHPTVPLARVPIMINVDMIGRLRDSRLEVFGVRTSPGLRKLVSRQNDVAALTLAFNWDIRPDSDHYSFCSRNVPFVMLHTGMHPDYHRPSDDAEKINVEGLKHVSQLMFGLVLEMADSPRLGPFRAVARSESQSIQRSRDRSISLPIGRLGVRWDEAKAKEGSIVAAAVTPGSTADKAGIRPGDRFVRFAGREVNGSDLFRLSVLAAKNPVEATIERPGAAEPINMTLELAGEPVRLGISWRTDDAEPGTVIVNRVTPGSAADLAGLHVGDRIYRIGGQDFADGEQFRQLAVNSSGRILLEVETLGRVRALEIVPIDARDDSSTSELEK